MHHEGGVPVGSTLASTRDFVQHFNSGVSTFLQYLVGRSHKNEDALVVARNYQMRHKRPKSYELSGYIPFILIDLLLAISHIALQPFYISFKPCGSLRDSAVGRCEIFSTKNLIKTCRRYIQQHKEVTFPYFTRWALVSR